MTAVRITSDAFGATVHPLLFTKEERGAAEQALIKVRAEVAAAVTTLATDIEASLQNVTFTDMKGQKVDIRGVGAGGGGAAAPGSEPVIPPFSEEEWRAAVLACHNAARAKHGAPPLEWSDECQSKALEQAVRTHAIRWLLVLARYSAEGLLAVALQEACEVEEKLHHGNYEGPSGRHGQNAYYCSAPPLPERAVTAFYNESKLYKQSAVARDLCAESERVVLMVDEQILTGCLCLIDSPDRLLVLD